MEGLYTNRTSKRDFIQNGLIENVENGMEIFIASAFFTEVNIINKFLEEKCHVKIIVRLGFPTCPYALEALLRSDNVEARFYTSNQFHPKLYIFKNKYILVGSANLTGQALLSNQEIVVGLNPDDARFDELTQLFFEYWDEAKVLTNESVSIYKKIYEKYEATQLVYDIEKNVINSLGNINFSNIDRARKKATKEEIYLDNYRKSYQESVTAYKKIQELYIQKPRKVSESQIPLRLEIDSFFSFVRDRYATKEIWKEQSLGWDEAKQNLLIRLIDEWLITYWGHFENNIVKHNYPQIKEIFSSPESIENSSMKEILDGLGVLHSFHDRLRFFPGGLDSLKARHNFWNQTALLKQKKA